MRSLIFLLMLFFAVPAFAGDEAMNVPQISFGKKVEIVVAAKQNANILDFKINQDKDIITCDLIINQNMTREETRKIASDVIMIAKSLSLDDPPKDKDKPGTGLYTYKLTATRPNGVLILTAQKPKAEKEISFEDQFPQSQPLTRADAAGR